MPRPPPRRIVVERSSENVKRALDPAPAPALLEALARRVRYRPYAKHKLQPRAFGLEPMAGVPEDASFCDGHAGWAPGDAVRLPDLMNRGIAAGLVGDRWRDGDPSLLWTVDNDGWIFEARLTLAGQALYHGYPMLPPDAMAAKVIARYANWVYGLADRDLIPSVEFAQERYAS